MTLYYFKKAYPFICNSCGDFSYNSAEYCGYCGTKGSLREAKIIDYKKRIDKRMPKRTDKKMSWISKGEAKKSLKNSIITIVIATFLFLIGLFFPIQTTITVYIFVFSITMMLVGIVSLILYFINPEISYGMWLNRNKIENFSTRNVLYGRRVRDVILITGLCITMVIFITMSLTFPILGS